MSDYIDNIAAELDRLFGNAGGCHDREDAQEVMELVHKHDETVKRLKQQLVKEMILTRTRTEMLEEFGPDYEQYL